MRASLPNLESGRLLKRRLKNKAGDWQQLQSGPVSFGGELGSGTLLLWPWYEVSPVGLGAGLHDYSI